MTTDELDRMKSGAPVEWLHRRGGWRPAVFLEHYPDRGSVRIRTELGCEVYRRCDSVRVPPPPQPPA